MGRHVEWWLLLVGHGAHQDERRELCGGPTGSIGGVDPQQVAGRYVQVMVSMGGRKNTHLSAGRANGQTFFKVLIETARFEGAEAASPTCLSSSTDPTFSSSSLSSRRRRCTVP